MWLVELYLSRLNELEDVIASESVSHDVQNLQTEYALLEDELRQFLVTYKVNFCALPRGFFLSENVSYRQTLIRTPSTN